VFNNVAVAAASALARGVARIAIVDIDVHHGNGTQAIFYDDPRVLYVSTHQYPFYPGTGAADEIGLGDGLAFTVNVPMEAGATDADYALVHHDVILPVLAAFRPELVLVSAGYDAHESDPLAAMRMTTEGYGLTVQRLQRTAVAHGAAIALIMEGGYDLTATAACVHRSIDVLSGRDEPAPASAMGGARGARAAAGTRRALRSHWPL
jgi:acetoin utilization deacetylase AcuC-like enzyme